jgi:hypothetical protein
MSCHAKRYLQEMAQQNAQGPKVSEGEKKCRLYACILVPNDLVCWPVEPFLLVLN